MCGQKGPYWYVIGEKQSRREEFEAWPTEKFSGQSFKSSFTSAKFTSAPLSAHKN